MGLPPLGRRVIYTSYLRANNTLKIQNLFAVFKDSGRKYAIFNKFTGYFFTKEIEDPVESAVK
jgi:hypothetical protein